MGYLDQLRAVAGSGPPAPVLLAVARTVAGAAGVDPAGLDRLRLAAMARSDGGGHPDGDRPSGPPAEPPERRAGRPGLPALPAGAGPALLGQAHEALLPRRGRRARGVYYTPADVAAALVARAGGHQVAAPQDRTAAAGADGAARDDGVTAPAVLDPACGGGAFLVAAAEWLAGLSPARPADAVVERLWGVDVDPLAVAVTEAVLALWAAGRGGAVRPLPQLTVGDTLVDGGRALHQPPVSGFDLVVGNPPFLNQLGRDTAHDPGRRAALQARFGAAAYRYTDAAALFVVEATRLAARGGRVALVLPEGVLSSADAAAARAAATERAAVVGAWFAGEPVFAAGVRVWAPVLEVDPVAAPVAVRRWTGRSLDEAPPLVLDAGTADAVAGGDWSALTRGLRGLPRVEVRGAGTLADLATATAGFRDQFYGLAPHVTDAGADRSGRPARSAPLITSGLIDPGGVRWGRRRTRFAGRALDAPVVDLDRLEDADPALAAWVAARLVPKVVVATQTRVVEAAVDAEGCWVPSVPVIAVHAHADDLWRVAAVLLAPPVSALALGRHAGSALSGDALRLSARQVLALPLPADAAAWAEGAAHLRRAADAHVAAPGRHREALLAMGAAMTAAFGADPTVTTWWADRLPAADHASGRQ